MSLSQQENNSKQQEPNTCNDHDECSPTSLVNPCTPETVENSTNSKIQSYFSRSMMLPRNPVVVLPLLNMIDMFSVSLVVPLLNQYYKDSGVTSASLRESINSLFSSSQIVGSLLVGVLSDFGFFSRKHILYLSFLGSALSYSLIVYGGVHALIASRIIVGAVKQTNTISTSIIASHTTPEERSSHMGRLSAYSTGAFILGPSVGGYLYKHVDPSAPALVAATLFLVNFILAAVFLPRDSPEQRSETDDGRSESDQQKFVSFFQNLKASFATKDLSSVVLTTLLYNWVLRATSYASMASYYEEMFGIESHQRGYLSSYTALVSFMFQTFFVQSTLRYIGGEYRAACGAAAAIALATTLELGANFHIFLIFICPVVAVANSILQVSLRSLLTQVAPKNSLGCVLAAMDVMLNAASVSVPFYRTILFKIMECTDEENSNAAMLGDPCPLMWLKSSILHWVIATVVMSQLLLGRSFHEKRD
jgi:MFS family permease